MSYIFKILGEKYKMKTLKLRLYYNKIFIVFCIISLILCSGHAFQSIFHSISYIPLVIALLFIVPIIYVYLKNNLNILLVSFLIFLIMISSTAIVYMGQSFIYYLFFVCEIIFAFGIVLIYEFKDFVNVFLKIMVFISIIGLLGYILLNNTTLLNNLPLLTNVNGWDYRTAVLFNYITMVPQRNCGMFWEPGIFATFLIYAIVFELVFKKGKPIVLRLILFAVCLYTTNSSAGYVLAFICVMILMVNKDKIKSKNLLFFFFASVLYFGLLVLIVNIPIIIQNTALINNPTLRKLLYENLSETTRTLAFSFNIKVFLQYPIFGAGVDFVRQNMIKVADTSTSTHLLSIYGIQALSYTFLWMYAILKNKRKNIFVNFSILFIIMAIVNKEPHSGIIFTWCVLFYLLKELIPNKIYVNDLFLQTQDGLYVNKHS